MDANSNDSLLLILPGNRGVYPLSPSALTQAQSSRRRLMKEYQGALVLFRDGTTRRISRIQVLGPWGQSFARRLLSRLTDGWRIAVHFEEGRPPDLAELKNAVLDWIADCSDEEFPGVNGSTSRRDVQAAIEAVTTAEQLFEVLNVPSAENALDVL